MMPSFVEKIIPGYNTAMVFWIMTIATSGFLILTIVRAVAYSGRRVDVCLCVLLVISLIVIVMAQADVQYVKSTRNLPKEAQPTQFTELAQQMQVIVWVIVLAGLVGLVIAGGLWFAGDQPYDKPWAVLTVSFCVSMAGMAVDYEEWRRITVLRSQGSFEKFRFPDMLHTGLNIAAYGVCLMGVVWCLVVYFQFTRAVARS